MHAEIELVKTHVLALYERQHEYLKSKPTPFLEELMHRCEDRDEATVFSTVVSNEINRAACVIILAERSMTTTTTTETKQ